MAILSRRTSANVFSLYLVQIANYIIPLTILPFLARTLGLEGFGKLIILQSIVTYGLVITDYGFHISATKRVAERLALGQGVGQLYTDVTSARLTLGVIASVLIVIFIVFYPGISASSASILAAILIVFSNASNPLWLFQGYQEMRTIALVVLISRVVSAALSLVLVQGIGDTDKALWSQAIGMALPVPYAVWKAGSLTSCGVNLDKVTFKGVIKEMREGWFIFQSAIFSSLLTNLGVIILGFSSGAQVAGGYGAVERLGKGISTLLNPVGQAFFPSISSKFAVDRGEGIRVLRKYGVVMVALAVFISMLSVLSVYSGIIGHLYGSGFRMYEESLYILSLWFIFGVVNNVLGIQFLSIIGRQRFYATSFSICAVVSILIFLLSYKYSFWAIPCGLLLGELLLSISLFYAVKTEGLFRGNLV